MRISLGLPSRSRVSGYVGIGWHDDDGGTALERLCGPLVSFRRFDEAS